MPQADFESCGLIWVRDGKERWILAVWNRDSAALRDLLQSQNGVRGGIVLELPGGRRRDVLNVLTLASGIQ